jgi:hypothetical protein
MVSPVSSMSGCGIRGAHAPPARRRAEEYLRPLHLFAKVDDCTEATTAIVDMQNVILCMAQVLEEV